MKAKFLFRIVALSLPLTTYNSAFTTCFAQGSLVPPASVAPNMKTLAQIEPRTPIASAGYTISQPGSYCLTTNLTVPSGNNGVLISASNVRLDLNGYAITSTANPASGYAIYLNGAQTNIAVVNGFIHSGVTNNGATFYGGPGFAGGIVSAGAWNVRIEGVQIYGCTSHGINLGTGTQTLVRHCNVNNVGGVGIAADLVLNCSVNAAGYGGSYAVQCGTACNCQSVSYAGAAISAAQNAADCRAVSVTGIGLIATVAANCSGVSSNSIGLDVTVANSCSGTSSLSSGIFTSVARNSVGGSSSGGSFAFNTVLLATGCAGNGSAAGINSSRSLISCVGNTVSALNKFNMP